jgi:hypothetical protein
LDSSTRLTLDDYQGYTLAPKDPVPDANGNVMMTHADQLAYKKALVEKVVEFYLLSQFRATLLPDLRRIINLQPMHSLDLDTAVCLATIKLCSKDEARGMSRIQAVQQEEEEDNVEGVTQNRQKKFFPQNTQNRGQQGCQNFRPQNNYRNNQNQQQWRNNNPGNNSNRNKMMCIFCRKQGHRQEDCRKRINSNQPCLDLSGKPFWPKVNTTDNGALIQALQDPDFQY